MEVAIDLTCEAATNAIPVPNDLLKLVAISYNNHDLVHADVSRARRLSTFIGIPEVYSRDGNSFVIGPMAGMGSTLKINYLAQFSPLVNSSDTNWLTENAPDVIISGAMVFACRFYRDIPNMQVYEAMFTQAIGDLNNQASQDELSNAVMAPGIDFNSSW